MNKLTAATGAGVTVLALSLALVGCGSDEKTTTSSSSSTTSSSKAPSSAEETTTSEEEPTTSAEASGPNKTIVDYIKENKITAVDVKRGDPGPTIDLPLPDGWEPKEGLPSAPYGAIVYPKSAVPDNPPRILAILSKLTGDVDPEEILTLAPGELKNLPGYNGGEGERDKLSGFDAVQLGGTYTDGGKTGMVAQKTVVIPVDGAVYVLQLNAFADESEAGIMGDATNIIDDKTKITP